MGVTTTNLIQGPATIYYGAFGATEPLTVATEPTGPAWTDCGATDGGVMLNITDTYSRLAVDQLLMAPESRRTERLVTVKTVLAEATLENLARAINNTAPASNTMSLDDGLTAFKPAYGAILLDGIAPGGFRRRVIVRKTLATDAVESAYKKDAKTALPVTFTSHWVSNSVKAVIWTDATS